MHMTRPPFLTAKNLSVSIGTQPILQDLSFSITQGAWIGLIGPNGSGKTTLLRALSGLLSYSGSLTLEARPILAWPAKELARRMAFVRQQHQVGFDFKVADVLLLGCLPHKRWLDPIYDTDRNKAQQALAQLNLEGFMERPITSLSGGEQRRVFLAQALVQETDILLLDEPTAHLDVYHQFEFLDHVSRLVQAQHTVIAVFHNLEQAARYASHLLVLNEGRVVAQGPPETTLNEALIREVFRMHNSVNISTDKTLHIKYLKPA
jgi:iron complex transport system ATP-binding protein